MSPFQLPPFQLPWAEAYYQQKRKEGHANALRCLGIRWLKILGKMWQEHRCYDAERHMRNQTRHGSWVLSLIPQPTMQLD